MKRIKLDSAKLQLRKEKVSNLTNEEMSKVLGGYNQPATNVSCPTEANTCTNHCGRTLSATIYINPNPLRGY